MSPRYMFPPPEPPALPLRDEAELYPVRRIFCVGRNYAEHAREMGAEVDREAPFYFTKSAQALHLSGTTAPFPPGTDNYHHEVELVVALGAPAFRVAAQQALDAVYGYAVGLDMTRRDLQQVAKTKNQPWDLAKDVEYSAIVGQITQAAGFAPADQAIRLTLNAAVQQDSRLSAMVWSVPDIIAHLSRFYRLGPGDLIFTGTPAGVGPVQPGDRLQGMIEGLDPVDVVLGPAE